jgi:hypothetical protein
MCTISRLPFILLALHWFLSCGFAAEALDWEAKIPPGAETDPIALNIAFGEKDIPNCDIVESLKGLYGIQPHSFPGLAPKTANNGIFKVEVKRGVPPNMAGTGPFYLVKIGNNYYALTRGNFAQMFSPIEKKTEVLPYLKVYESIFGNQFAKIVTKDTAKELFKKGAPEAPKPGQITQEPLKVTLKPPKFTQVAELKDGFRVTLVTYTQYHIEAFLEKTVHIGRNGVVKEEKPERILKEIGAGFVF